MSMARDADLSEHWRLQVRERKRSRDLAIGKGFASWQCPLRTYANISTSVRHLERSGPRAVVFVPGALAGQSDSLKSTETRKPS